MRYLHGEKDVPVYSTTTHYSYSEAVNILLAAKHDKICTRHPTLVEDNLCFVVDLSKLAHVDDIKADDCGHWIHNGKKTTKVAVWKHGNVISKVVSTKASSPPDENSQLYTLVRVYYVNDPHGDFKRTHYYLFDDKQLRHNLCLVCYSFDREPHQINPRPHGNSKSGQKYVRTMKSTAVKMGSSNSSSLKDTMAEVINDAGGMINSWCAGALPKSHQQVSYYKCKEKGQEDQGHKFDVLYNVMLQCKSSNPGNEFVRAVAAAPEPMAVLATDRQLDDMVRFLTDPVEFAIMGVDPTFNFGTFNVTPTVYRNLLLEHRTKGHSPVMLGPMLVHHQKKFSSYNFFASTLISLRPALRNIIAFGTDGENDLYKAFSVNFPYAIHLRCFRHYRSNLSSKLKDLGIPSSVAETFLSDIFGKTDDQIYTEGIVDASDSQNFQERLEGLQDVWDSREQECNPGKVPAFFDWFVANKSDEVVDNMFRPIREAAGLGSPPSPYYTNDSECINSVMHSKTHYKASEWDKFNLSMQELVEQSYKLLELAVIDKGAARFRSMYKDLVVDQLQWVRMTSKQRELHLRKVATRKVVGSLSNTDETSVLDDGNDYSPLSLSPEEANLSNIPLETVRGIWTKAKSLLETPRAVVNGPCFSASVNSTVIVASKSSAKPRTIICKPQGVISCENTCPHWASLQICSHSVAAAQFDCELEIFLENIVKRNVPQI
ncbi:uncharacterized protein [Dysidea avara]|uniref:uncharacterized protein n=1 Tax=Dysidea avara TaxID=196820 RepID=UPI00332AB19F